MFKAIGFFLGRAFGSGSRKTDERDLHEQHVEQSVFHQDLPRFLNDEDAASGKKQKRSWWSGRSKKSKSASEPSNFYPHNRSSYENKEHRSQPESERKFPTAHQTGDITIVRTWQAKVILFFMYWGTISAIWGVLGIVGMVAVYSYLAPDPLKAGLSKKAANIIMKASNGKVIAEKGLRRNHIHLNQMPKHMVNAVLATEDQRFYYHFGFDPIGITRAMIANKRAGRIVQGGSTITQQLAKVLFLRPKKTYWRKVEEMLLALWLEYRLEKNEILELYLNRIYFGAGNHGIEAAAQHYFGKTITDVTLYEAALLAGLIKSPSYYAPTRNYSRSLLRGKVVLQNMKNAWFISGVQYKQAIALPPKLRSYLPSESYGHVIDHVMEVVAEYGQDLQEDMVVETTIDYELQGAAQRMVRENMDLQAKKFNAGQAAAIIMDKRGAIVAMVGGRDYRKSPFNRVVKSRRQPGSTFKPFVYLAAMEKGMTPDSEVYDGPIEVGGWSPKNYNNRYYGDVSLRQSLAKSLNTVSVRLAEWVGRERVIKTAHRLGISTKLKNNPSIALGTSEVSLMEITAAYAPFANGGYAVRPHIIKKISDQNGRILYKNSTKNWGRVVRSHYVAAMNDMLTATIMVGTGQKASLAPHQAAGKTGTGQSYRDAWFIGYTAHYLTGVWIGNDDFKPMGRVTGGSLPTTIWKDLMTYAHSNKQPQALPGGRWEHNKQNWASNEYGDDGRRRRSSGSFFSRLFDFGSSSRSSPDDTTLGSPPPGGRVFGRPSTSGYDDDDPFSADR